MEFRLNIFTCCNGIYKDFIPLFILSNLYHNDNCFVEVGVDKITENILDSINVLTKNFNTRFLVREVLFSKHKVGDKTFSFAPNTVRFFTTPITKSEYVYISDVDIINLQKNICDIHINNMDKTKLPYSNIVRPIKNRLTGLHFTKYKNYYPIPDFSDLVDRGVMNDENFLFELVKKRYPDFNFDETYRPVHGIHVSPNREHNRKLGWGLSKWKNQWTDFRNSKIFLELEPTLSNMINDKIKIIDNHYK